LKYIAYILFNDFKSIFKFNILMKYLKYRVKYPYLSLSTSVQIGNNVTLEENIGIGKDSVISGNIIIGRNTTINNSCKVFGNVSIGDNCLFSNNIFISSGTHIYDYIPELCIKEQDLITSVDNEIIIEDDCWLGMNVVVLPGVKIGKGSIIGANCVVTKNVEPYNIVAGVPGNVINKRLTFIPPSSLEYNNIKCLPYFYKGFHLREYEKNKFKVYDGYLTKEQFTICIKHKNEITIECRKYKENATLVYKENIIDINSESFNVVILKVTEVSDFINIYVSNRIVLKRIF